MASGASGPAEPRRRLTTALAVTSLVCALVALPYVLLSLGALDLLGPGATISRGALSLTIGLPVLAVICGVAGLARVKSTGGRGRRSAIVGLWLGGLEASVFTLALVVFVHHGDHLA